MTKTILIFEDDLELGATIEHVLKAAGYAVLLANTFEDAIRHVYSTPIDLVISDVLIAKTAGSSGCGGVSFMSEIRTRARRPIRNIPIIAISGGFSQRTEITPLTMARDVGGADRTLAKPFEMDVLLSLVAELLADTRTQTAKTAKAGTKLPQAIAGGRPRALVERAAGHKKILVVEDDLEGVDALREVLLRHGYEVDFATDVARAGELVSARHYDAVLTDVLLPSDQSNPTPKPSGAVKVIRHTHAAAKSRGQRIPVIVISGGFSGGAKASDMLDMTVSLSGSAAALTKPVEPTDLIGALEAAWA